MSEGWVSNERWAGAVADLQPLLEAITRDVQALALVTGHSGWPWQTAEQVAMDAAAAPVTAHRLIAGERRRQILVEGFTEGHDRQHTPSALGKAAGCYEIGDASWWPWDMAWWKPKTRLRDLVRAGALYQAAADMETRPSGRARWERDRDRVAAALDAELAEARRLLALGA